MAAEVNKPDFSYQWASGGSIVTPSNVKMQTGWTAEVPPFQWENYLQNRQDNAILHLFQKGISEWDATSNYYFTTSGVRSYVQGGNGKVYVAVADSVGQNPVTDTSNAYWVEAFSSSTESVTFTTTGSTPTLVLTPAPAAVSYVNNQRFRVKFNSNSTGSDTINVSGLGPKGLKQYAAGGTKVAAVFSTNQLADIQYDGTDFVVLNQVVSAATTAIQGIVQLATNAQMATGTSTSLVPSVAAVMSLFSKREFSTNDYIRIPDVNGGLLIQFGLVNCSAAADTHVTFPTPFPGALRFIAGQVVSNVNNVGYVFTSESELASGFTCNAITAGGRNAVQALWCAIGY